MAWWNWILAFTWELPQTLVALVCLLLLRCKRIESDDKMVYTHTNKFLTGWSLGEFIFLKDWYLYLPDYETIYKHESGHSKQSKLFGPFFLLFIGLPSAIWNLLSRKVKWCSDHYYDTPWEHGADVLGGVIR